MRRAGSVSVSGTILFALLCSALISSLSGPVGAQETTAEEAADTTAGRQQVAQADNGALKFQEGTDATGQRAREDRPAGPLSGTKVGTRSTDGDVFVERILIPRPDCDLVRGKTASFVLEDEDGTQADFIEDVNIRIKETRSGFRVTSNLKAPDDDIIPRNERGSDDVLDTGGLTIVTSTGIRCEDGGDNGDNGDTGNGNDGDDNNPGVATADNQDDGADNDQYNVGDVSDPDDVVPNTGDKGPLPNTGGAPILFGAAALALSAALLARRILAP
jgi:hypothetical protein